jgi:predicted DsbA family dithiol-disulfide isomerase
VSARVEVTHFADAGCPWDYSAEPVRIALEERYGDQLVWRNVQVGLYESGEAMARRGYTPAGLAESYRIFQDRYGMPFCAQEPPRLIGTWPGARAVKAAELQNPALGEALLRRLRLARFVELRTVDERDELVRLAADVQGLDPQRFAIDLDREASAIALECDMDAARRANRVARALEKTAELVGADGARYTTPTYLFEIDGRSATVPGFQPLAAYEVVLQNLAPELERRPAPDPVGFVRARAGEDYATVEIAAAVARSERHTTEKLEAALADGSVVRKAVGARELWSWGPRTVKLACPARPHLYEPLDQALAA